MTAGLRWIALIDVEGFLKWGPQTSWTVVISVGKPKVFVCSPPLRIQYIVSQSWKKTSEIYCMTPQQHRSVQHANQHNPHRREIALIFLKSMLCVCVCGFVCVCLTKREPANQQLKPAKINPAGKEQTRTTWFCASLKWRWISQPPSRTIPYQTAQKEVSWKKWWPANWIHLDREFNRRSPWLKIKVLVGHTCGAGQYDQS